MPTRSAQNEKLFGRTTLEIADKVSAPIMVMRPQRVSTYRETELSQRCQHLFDYILVPYDGSGSAKKLVGEIKAQIQSNPEGALQTCLLCWVVDDGGRIASNNPTEAAQAQLDKVKADLEGFGTEIKTEVRVGNPLEELMKSGEIHDISAIAVCSGKSKGILKLTVPSFTNAIMRASWHPIIHFPREN